MKLALWTFFIICVIALIAVIPALSIDADSVLQSSAVDYVRMALYFLPTGTCAAILTITAGLWIFRIVIALIKTIWDMFPT